MTRAFWVLLQREFGAFLLSPLAYVVFFCLTFINAGLFYFCVSFIERGVPNYTIIQIFFLIPFFWFCVIPLAPILTMRLFSEEYRAGTIELLMTAPVTDWDVILSKFFGALGFFAVLWTPTALFLGIFQSITHHAVPISWGSTLLCYLMVVFLGMLYTAIGLYASSLSRSQAVAAFLSFAIIIGLFIASFVVFFNNSTEVADLVNIFSARRHMETFADGIFDSRVAVWYLSSTALFLALTQRVLAAKRIKA
ncbi:MAG: ABC transporter permease [Candidatus Methylacidiphilales bacterium]|nr:ABC transporter permease [Candidatus Methylacidiphilales bacterium]